MNKPKFDPNQPFQATDAKPAFDPNQPFEAMDQNQPGLNIGDAWNQAKEQVSNTPIGVVAGFQDTIDTGAKKLGQFATKSLERGGFNMAPLLSPSKKVPVSPMAAKILGKTIEYALAVASILATPIETSGKAVESAVPFARRALGFQKSMLKTPFARGQATKAAEMALEKDIIPLSGNPQTMYQNATELAAKSGQKIGNTLKQIPADLGKAFDDLEILRSNLTKGMKSGIYAKTNEAINAIQDNVLELASKGPNLTVGALNDVKSRLGQSLNYLSDLASQGDNKAIQNTLANTVRELVKNHISPEEFTSYLNNQKLYGAAKLMQKGLNNEIAGQMGNAAVSLPSIGLAAGELATGNPVRAAATMGLTEGLKRRGAGTTAALLQKVGSNAAGVGLVGSEMGKKLTKQKAAEFLDQANGDKVKARELAKQAGWKWPTSLTK